MMAELHAFVQQRRDLYPASIATPTHSPSPTIIIPLLVNIDRFFDKVPCSVPSIAPRTYRYTVLLQVKGRGEKVQGNKIKKEKYKEAIDDVCISVLAHALTKGNILARQ